MLKPGLLSAALLLAVCPLVAAGITEKNIRFVDYPDFPEAHSSWGSIGYSSRCDRVYVGVTNHRDRVGLFEYDVATEKMRLCGFLPELAHLRDPDWQGKMHSQIVEGPDGGMYFSTDGGELRHLYLMDHPQGYGGGYFFRWDPAENSLACLGRTPEYESVKDLMVDRVSGLIVGVTFPMVHLLTYDWRRNDLRDLGRLGSGHVPRVLFGDRWGNVYYVDWRQRLVKYEHDTGRLLFSSDSLPAFAGTEGDRIITGITAWAEDRDTGVIYLVTYGSMLIAYHPTRTGFGRTEALGGIFDGKLKKPYEYYCPNLALGANGRLYYFIGGHGSFVEGSDMNVLVEFDPASRAKRVLLTFPRDVIEEVTGSGVRDSRGNLYFAGRRNDPQAERMGESGASRPFMIVFNPEKELQP
jgi:hypothetical protein